VRIVPYGSWPSPVAATDLTATVVGLDRGVVDGNRALWTEAHPEQGGRVSLWASDAGGDPIELTPDHNVRNAINEYGGGAWAAAQGWVVYSTAPSGELFLRGPRGGRRLLAPGGDHRYGCLVLLPRQRLVLAVREDHTGDDIVTQSLVRLDLNTMNPDGGTVLACGADFYASPALRPDGMLAWVEWQLPSMPWDATRLMVAPLDHPEQAVQVAGGPQESAVFPAWSPDGSLVYLSDAPGHWNFHHWDGELTRRLHRHAWDFCEPMWAPDPAPYTILADGRIGCSWLEDGIGRLGLLGPGGPVGDWLLEPIETGAVSCTLSGTGARVVVLLGYAERPAELHLLDLVGGNDRVLRRTAARALSEALVSRAQPLSWDSPDGPVHAWYYPPTNPNCYAPVGELPPVQVWSHGGPTAFSDASFALRTQFWTTRGIGILDVNYSGSSGYGRAYRERLQGRWGIVDVRDCVEGARALVDARLADPSRLSIRGGSAGGYTALAALTSTDVFAAGISLYGIGDLEALATDTHKFESGYTDSLIAPWPEGRETYRERSPINHLDQLSCPMLILQGRLDRVVPPNQAEAMAAAVRAKGLPVELVWFDAEGHGFRRAESIIATARAALAFLGRVHGFVPAVA
jgi:dipeptidyl aminopeptidase/acylaminoacyl peptidase